ncbi:homoserine dehydrogenase [Nanoarchaeota archaeon]
MAQETINIGLIGFGTIGSGVVKRLLKPADIEKKTGKKIVLKKIVDKKLGVKRKVKVPKSMLTKNVNDVLNDPEIDIFIELIGGYKPAYDHIKKALQKGKNVITANKAVMDKYGAELCKIAEKNNVFLMFGASVGGGIPIIDSITDSLAGNDTEIIYGILNGTTNFILTKMEQGMEYDQALKLAQKLGFAEKDPTFDVEGLDAAQKLAIISSIAFNTNIKSKQIFTQGITKVSKKDLDFVKKLGYKIKLIGVAKKPKLSRAQLGPISAERKFGKGNVLELRVQPTLIPDTHPLAAINNEVNAVYFGGDGNITLSGEGAGSAPTAGAVISDIISIGKRIKCKYKAKKYFGNSAVKIRNIEQVETPFYLRFTSMDKPGTLAELTDVLAKSKVNIKEVLQPSKNGKTTAPLAIITDMTDMKTLKKAISKLKKSKKNKIEIIMPIEE